MNEGISPTDQLILGMIMKNYTFQEMADELGFAARSAVFKRVNKLIKSGLIQKRPGKARSRELTEDGRKLLYTTPVGKSRTE